MNLTHILPAPHRRWPWRACSSANANLPHSSRFHQRSAPPSSPVSPPQTPQFSRHTVTDDAPTAHTEPWTDMMTSWHGGENVISMKPFSRYWLFVRGIHRSPVNSPRKGQWRGALMFSLICSWIDGWVNNREAGDLRRHRARYDVTVMSNTMFEGESS